MTSSSHRIRQVLLESFQVIRERTVFDLSPVTLLYGPNSSGKSSLYDALTLIGRVLDPESAGKQSVQVQIEQSVKKWFHQGPLQGWRSDGPMVIGVEVEAALAGQPVAEFYDSMGKECNLASWMFDFKKPRVMGVTLRFHQPFLGCEMDATYSVDGVPFVRRVDVLDGGLHINLAHPLVAEDEQIVSMLSLFVAQSSGWAEITLLPKQGEAGNKESFIYQDGQSGKYGYAYSSDLRAASRIARGRAFDFCTHELSPSVAALAVFLLELVDEIVADAIHAAIQVAFVPAARSLPRDSELTFDSSAWTSSVDRAKVTSAGTATMALLASHAAEWLAPQAQSHVHPREEPLSGFVDRCLRESLFRDAGYRISPAASVVFDVTRTTVMPESNNQRISAIGGMLPPSKWAETLNGLKPSVLRFGSVVGESVDGGVRLRLKLSDNFDRWLEVEDVGSGIGYVLPCLVAWWYPESFVCQPELHLHPALQAALADVLVEVKRQGRQTLVESHSEHLLLRLLRRVRETSSGRGDADLRPADVVVYYFDPRPDGTTVVKRIRITRDGDFLDRWPQGFFEERAKDLFDE